MADEQSVKLFAQTTDYSGYSTSLNNLASSYENQGDFDNALTYYKQTLLVLQKTNLTADVANVLYGIASVYDKKGNHLIEILHIRYLHSCRTGEN